MQQIVYELSPIKIYRVKGTSLAFSLDTQESLTVLRFYEISADEVTYTKIGIRTSQIQLYSALKSHRRMICDIINNFIDTNPSYKHLLK